MSHFRPPADTAHLKAQIDLRDIVERLWGPPKTRNRDYLRYHAPDRGERTASLTIWADGFKDFGDTRKGGDHFTFLERYEGMDFQAALAFLSGDSSVNGKATKLRHKARRRSGMSKDTPSSAWEAPAKRLLQRCQEVLSNSPQVVQFLTELGYTKSTIGARGLGFNPHWTPLNWQDENGKTAWLPPGIVYPWMLDGRLYALKVRCPYRTADGTPDALATLMDSPPQSAKYMQIAGGNTRAAWYGDVSTPPRPVILCEGEKDRDLLWQAAGEQVDVVTLGSATGVLPPQLIQHLTNSPWVAIVLDNDDAGRQNTARLSRELLDAELNIPVLSANVPTSYKDIADWLNSDDPDFDYWLTDLQSTGAMLKTLQYTPAEHLYVLPNGVPDALRELILGLHTLAPQGKRYIQDQAGALIVLELLQKLVLNGPTTPSVTMQALKDAQTDTPFAASDSTLRRGLAQLTALGFLSDLPPLAVCEQNKGGNSGENSSGGTKTRGRPAKVWWVKPLPVALESLLENMTRRLREARFADAYPDQVSADWFTTVVDAATAEDAANAIARLTADLCEMVAADVRGIEDDIRTQRTEWAKMLRMSALTFGRASTLPEDMVISCGRDFRDAYYVAQIRNAGRVGRQIARAKAAAQLGVASNTLRQIRARTGVIAIPQFEMIPFEERPHDVCRVADRMARWAAGREFGRYLESSGGAVIRLDLNDPDAMTQWVHLQMAIGNQVWLKVQVASLERFATEEELVAQRELALEQEEIAASPLAATTSARVRTGTHVHIESETPPIEETSVNAASCGFVFDQLRQVVLWLAEDAAAVLADEPSLCEVLEAFGVSKGRAMGRLRYNLRGS